jgi:pimeloyl-ACP methyl ester carboxylesterase
MNIIRHWLKPVLIAVIVIASFTSCRKDEGGNYKYFISKELAVSHSEAYISALLNFAAPEYPELNDLTSYLSGDVNVYKIVYRTKVFNDDINASGLVCTPSSGGNYPVICFQNGTNTLNSSAPSEYPLNLMYQFVEFVASMGYIVVIPDYPGFGESADIPHPYLIKEPTVRSTVDMLYAVREMLPGEITGVEAEKNLYVFGYSQGGWATLALHKDIEQNHSDDFDLKGSVCGAGPYNLNLLFSGMTTTTAYPMPVYIGYIVNAYSVYHQFTNPVSDIFKEPYASRLGSLYTGTLGSDQINSQLTTSVPDLFTADFLSGFLSDSKYSSVREGLAANSITAWKTSVPVYFIHGGGDTSVNPITTENIYSDMIQAGTSADICKKEILPGLDHGDAVVPAMVKGLLFIRNL